jgi:hypothetical protein|tara:strand:+ start:127 stop:564 length:438 start_codon:yes stop_codon:yes gene_type:complete
MADIQNFLTMHPDDIPETQVLPEGSYDFVITSYRSDKVGEKQNEIVRINVKAQAVLESDITDGDLENCEPTRLEFWATKNALKQGNPVISLKSFLFNAMSMDKVGFGEALEQSIGQTFSAVVKHEMVGRNKDILQASVSRILKAA